MNNPPTSPANPNALPEVWIDLLFKRFSTMYGSEWSAKWAGIPLEDVKATWAQDLARFDAPTIRRALDHCKANCKFPPSCPEFVGFCKAWRATGDCLQLPAPRGGPIDSRVLAEINRFAASRKFEPRNWAREILAAEADGSYRHVYGIRCAKVALGIIEE
jgi:hypothetical protein